MSALAANLAVAASVLLGGVSTVLLAIGAVAYRRVRHARLLWVAAAFALFAVQGALLAFASYERRSEVAAGDTLLVWVALSGLATVLCLYFAVLKR